VIRGDPCDIDLGAAARPDALHAPGHQEPTVSEVDVLIVLVPELAPVIEHLPLFSDSLVATAGSGREPERGELLRPTRLAVLVVEREHGFEILAVEGFPPELHGATHDRSAQPGWRQPPNPAGQRSVESREAEGDALLDAATLRGFKRQRSADGVDVLLRHGSPSISRAYGRYR
jgi:hypothetical protein